MSERPQDTAKMPPDPRRQRAYEVALPPDVDDFVQKQLKSQETVGDYLANLAREKMEVAGGNNSGTMESGVEPRSESLMGLAGLGAQAVARDRRRSICQRVER